MGKLGDFKSRDPCCVPQCKSRCTNEVSLFSFPKDETLRKTWANAIRIEKTITNNMQVCNRHFVKNDYILSDSGGSKVRRLKKSAVPSQNLPWQFPNKHVSPALAQARMERLKKRTQLKISSPADHESDSCAHSEPESVKAAPNIKDERSDDESADAKPLKSSDFTKEEKSADNKESKNEIAEKTSGNEIERSNENASEAKKAENDVESRAPTRLGQRKSVLKCELCGRKCLTPQALRNHQQIAHKTATKDHSSPENKSPAMIKAKEPVKVAPRAFISVKQPEELISPKSLPKAVNKNELLVEQVIRDFDSDGAGTDTDYSSDESAKKEQMKPAKRDRRKTEFECPKCKKRFAVYFSASQHIQKHHPARQGDKVRTASVLKPNRIEICTICSLTLTSDVHVCIGPLKLAPGFICTGCTQEFKTLTLFDMHKSGMHSDGVESMFFPTLDEFENWKTKMEEQTEVKYTVLDQNDTKKIHRCAHVTTSGAGLKSRAHMCPSSIIVQEFVKGFQVHYYPNHFGHECEPYNLSNAFKKYSIASLMNVSTSQPSQPPNDVTPSDEDAAEPDLYLQFKKLTELLINEAARINVNALKKLMRKALEMSAIINSYDEDDDMMSTPSIADSDDLQDQIKKAFQTFKKSEKRKNSVEILEPPAKKTKPVFQSTENTLKEKNKVVKKDTAVIKMKEEIENLSDTKKETANQKTNQSPSFIDSYQEFVGKSMVKPKPVEKKKPKAEKKPVMKTRMGQFKPSPPKKLSTPEPKPVKTRLSQFKSSPPKKLSTPEPISPARNSIGSIKDIKYEVKEQENDCNILILKI